MEKLIYRKVLDKIGLQSQKHSIVVLLGARQTGKTSLMKMFKDRIYEKNPGTPILFCDCEMISYREIFSTYEGALSYLKGQVGTLDADVFLFLDEFQKVSNIGSALKLFADHHPNIKVIASGSSSLEIRERLDESMVGRKRMIEIFPLHFEEFLRFIDHGEARAFESYLKEARWDVAGIYQSPFEEHMLFGGLPRVSLEKIVEEKKEELKEIYTSYLEKDIKSYIKEERIVPFNKLLKLIAFQIGNLVSIEELAATTGLKRHEVEDFLHILEQTHIIFFLSPFHSNLRKELTKKRKVYFYDLGLRNFLAGSFASVRERSDGGALFENSVIVELIKHASVGDGFYFWQTQQGSEVDLVIRRDEKVLAVEIKLGLNTLRALRGLKSFCAHYKNASPFIVSLEKPKRIPEDVQSIPACFAAHVLFSEESVIPN